MLMKTNGDVIILAMNLDEDLGPLSMYSNAGLMYVRTTPSILSSLFLPMIMLAIFQVYSVACFATNAFGMYRLYVFN